MVYYSTSTQHILAELERIDLLIRVQVWQARQLYAGDDLLAGLYISEEEIETLLAEPAGLPRWATAAAPVSRPENQAALDQIEAGLARSRAESARQGINLRLETLARLFQLTPFEVDALLVCLAPELDLRYERLYAYLQDDLSKKRPSIDLILNLLCPSFETKLAHRQRFAPNAPLRQHRLLHLFEDPSQPHPPLLGQYLKVDERVTSFLLDVDDIDHRLRPYARLVTPQTRLAQLLLPSGFRERLAHLVQATQAGQTGLTLYFQGPYGVGKQTTAEALCHEVGLNMLVIDGPRLLAGQEPAWDEALTLIEREALLQDSALYWQGFEALLADDQVFRRDALVRFLEHRRGLAFLAGNITWEPVDSFQQQPFVRVPFSRPDYAGRLQLWSQSLNGQGPSEADLKALANKFRFSGGQVRDAAATARYLARWRDPDNGRVTAADLYAACRLQSNRRLGALAQKIEPLYTWPDIVLPDDQMDQLAAICSFVKHRARVYHDWGFDRKLSLGKGLNVLFAGPSGTGKTMAAEIIANELGLDLYKIDLSTVVSKYIGETEKNLARVFDEAETSNAILFFDEADALFGKRSEVKDAHDRYANIEISYLLQKMEAYEGVVILATNLRRNLDDAFARRMALTITFPLPEEEDRLAIWQRVWPPETPLAADVDLAFLARQFKFTGGNIKNVALAAAFLAAEEAETGARVGMAHLIRATRQEFQKTGKAVVARDFGKYAEYAVRSA